ncbi:molecular chaperone DnaK [Neisseria gonorrhoeae]|uniref:Molecular chaperone DnaK n=1 Tax=Neisseria gonorrhoeae TaxID=485 RepID=A0A378VTB2_NEIGO|nr:molecular chaperone DnaK [Neisseria gonorrhoeae]
MADYGDKLDAAEKEKIEAALKEAEEAVKGDDKTAIDAKAEALGTASQNWAKWFTRKRKPKPKPARAHKPMLLQRKTMMS